MTNPPEPPAPITEDASSPIPAARGRTAPALAPPRQRWRLRVAQPAATEAERRTEGGGRGWAGILADSGLPFAVESGGRIRVAQAAPLPLGVAGEREVVDVYLADRRTIVEVRDAVAGVLPRGWLLVDLHDVWVGAPAAPAAVVAGVYRALLAGPPRWAVEGAALALLAAEALPRERRKEKRTIAYDLRPLLLDLRVRSSGGEGITLAVCLRHAPDAVGRPEEALAALGEPPAAPFAVPLVVHSLVRERLIMADDPDAPPAR